MIIDTHTHFYDPSRPQGVPWPPRDNRLLYRTVLPPEYEGQSHPLGIIGSVVVEASAWIADNRWLLDLARREPTILGVVGRLDPLAEEFAEQIAALAAEPLFRGIRCGGNVLTEPPGARLVASLRRLADLGLTLDVLASPAQLPALAALGRLVPDLTIVINHLGHVPVDGNAPPETWLTGLRAVAAAAPAAVMKVSAYMELSRQQPAPRGVDFYAEVFAAVWAAFGPERVLFGSNWPVCERSGKLEDMVAIARAWAARLPAADAEAFLSGNARRVYRLPRP